MHTDNRKFQAFVKAARDFAHTVSEDKVTVYAAQASFFVIISAVPFLSLLISIVSLVIRTDLSGVLTAYPLSEDLSELLGPIIKDLETAPQVSLLSLSAITALWSASKGISAIRAGLESIYHADAPSGYFLQRLKSLVNTLIFILLILFTVVLLLFGDFLFGLFRKLPLLGRLTSLDLGGISLRWRTPFLILFMCVVFTAMYASTAKRSRNVHGLKTSILPHLPGALVASVGWILFSFFYSLYLRYFPNASYIYGSLAALCLIMLWLYFCMTIFLLGAEVNKLLFGKRTASPAGSAVDLAEGLSTDSPSGKPPSAAGPASERPSDPGGKAPR
ncbi:MAG: YihY/virulence factor BrkB family protein [Gemmiger sp.]